MMQEFNYNAINVASTSNNINCSPRNYLTCETIVTPITWDNIIHSSPLNADSVHYDESVSQNSDSQQLAKLRGNISQTVSTSGDKIFPKSDNNNHHNLLTEKKK